MTQENIYKKAIQKWGADTQLIMAMGECGELISVLNRHLTQGRASYDKIIDEIADVMIMMEQLQVMFGKDKVQEKKKEKLERLSIRLEAD